MENQRIQQLEVWLGRQPHMPVARMTWLEHRPLAGLMQREAKTLTAQEDFQILGTAEFPLLYALEHC